MAVVWPMIKELVAIRTRLDECLDENRYLGVSPASDGSSGTFRPAADLFEDDCHVVLVIEVPGIRRAELSIAVQGQRLRISGVTTAVDRGRRFLRLERPGGSFVREFELPSPVEADDIESTLERGVLTVVLTKVGARGAGDAEGTP